MYGTPLRISVMAAIEEILRVMIPLILHCCDTVVMCYGHWCHGLSLQSVVSLQNRSQVRFRKKAAIAATAAFRSITTLVMIHEYLLIYLMTLVPSLK